MGIAWREWRLKMEVNMVLQGDGIDEDVLIAPV